MNAPRGPVQRGPRPAVASRCGGRCRARQRAGTGASASCGVSARCGALWTIVYA
jgi:hypothetical protein